MKRSNITVVSQPQPPQKKAYIPMLGGHSQRPQHEYIPVRQQQTRQSGLPSSAAGGQGGKVVTFGPGGSPSEKLYKQGSNKQKKVKKVSILTGNDESLVLKTTNPLHVAGSSDSKQKSILASEYKTGGSNSAMGERIERITQSNPYSLDNTIAAYSPVKTLLMREQKAIAQYIKQYRKPIRSHNVSKSFDARAPMGHPVENKINSAYFTPVRQSPTRDSQDSMSKSRSQSSNRRQRQQAEEQMRQLIKQTQQFLNEKAEIYPLAIGQIDHQLFQFPPGMNYLVKTPKSKSSLSRTSPVRLSSTLANQREFDHLKMYGHTTKMSAIDGPVRKSRHGSSNRQSPYRHDVSQAQDITPNSSPKQDESKKKPVGHQHQQSQGSKIAAEAKTMEQNHFAAIFQKRQSMSSQQSYRHKKSQQQESFHNQKQKSHSKDRQQKQAKDTIQNLIKTAKEQRHRRQTSRSTSAFRSRQADAEKKHVQRVASKSRDRSKPATKQSIATAQHVLSQYPIQPKKHLTLASEAGTDNTFEIDRFKQHIKEIGLPSTTKASLLVKQSYPMGTSPGGDQPTISRVLATQRQPMGTTAADRKKYARAKSAREGQMTNRLATGTSETDLCSYRGGAQLKTGSSQKQLVPIDKQGIQRAETTTTPKFRQCAMYNDVSTHYMQEKPKKSQQDALSKSKTRRQAHHEKKVIKNLEQRLYYNNLFKASNRQVQKYFNNFEGGALTAEELEDKFQKNQSKLDLIKKQMKKQVAFDSGPFNAQVHASGFVKKQQKMYEQPSLPAPDQSLEVETKLKLIYNLNPVEKTQRYLLDNWKNQSSKKKTMPYSCRSKSAAQVVIVKNGQSVLAKAAARRDQQEPGE